MENGAATPERPQVWTRPGRPWPLWATWISTFAGLTFASSVAGGGWAWAHYGTPVVGLAILRGEGVWLDRRSFELEPLALGERKPLTVRVGNLSSRPLVVQGMTGLCSPTGCVRTWETFPLTLPPWGTRPINFEAEAPKVAGLPVRLESELYTDAGHHRLQIRGTTRVGPPIPGR